MFIYDILLGPHFVTHVPWAGTFLKDYVLHIIYVIYSATHIYDIYLWLVSASFIVRLDEPTLILQTVQLSLTTEIFPHVMSTMALMIFLLIDMRMWYLLVFSRAGFGFDISLSRLCIYIRVSFAELNNNILDAIYGRWHGSCLYCAWFIYRSTCWHAVMIFNVVLHLSWCAISLTIWTLYWINGIHLLSCPHGQGNSQKRGLTF